MLQRNTSAEATRSGEFVLQTMNSNKLLEIAREIKASNATTFVIFSSASHLAKLAKFLERERVTKTWIASEAWAISKTVQSSGRKYRFASKIA